MGPKHTDDYPNSAQWTNQPNFARPTPDFPSRKPLVRPQSDEDRSNKWCNISINQRAVQKQYATTCHEESHLSVIDRVFCRVIAVVLEKDTIGPPLLRNLRKGRRLPWWDCLDNFTARSSCKGRFSNDYNVTVAKKILRRKRGLPLASASTSSCLWLVPISATPA